jgi:hypothetical protein
MLRAASARWALALITLARDQQQEHERNTD